MVRIAGMPGPTIGSAASVGRGRTLAQVFRRFGAVAAARASPLYERVAIALSESDEALRAIQTAPARKRHPTVIRWRWLRRPLRCCCKVTPSR